MDKPFQSIGSLFALIICSIFLGLSGGESPGSVGSDLTKSKAEVETDTIFVEGFQAIQPNSYSGELSFFSAGVYDDPLFGSIEANGFLKPALIDDSNNIEGDAKMLLRVILDEDQVYGDDSATQEFNVYEIGELWRDRALSIYDDIQINTFQKVGELTVGTRDSLDVELSQRWVSKYRRLVNSEDADSLYKYDFFGLAIVPNNENKIIPLSSSSTRFVIQNPEADTFDVATGEWGYNLKRTEDSSFPQGSLPLSSTYESVIHFGELVTSEIDIQASGLSKAELILYENSSVMEQSLQSEPATVQRPDKPTAYLHLADPKDIPENIDPGAPQEGRIEGTYSPSEGTYRFNITNRIERIIQGGRPEEREFYVTLPNDGVIKQSLIYTDSEQVQVDKRPKILITSLNKSNN
jgi:hypothetical protein